MVNLDLGQLGAFDQHQMVKQVNCNTKRSSRMTVPSETTCIQMIKQDDCGRRGDPPRGEGW
jgi:hypothetical protein